MSIDKLFFLEIIIIFISVSISLASDGVVGRAEIRELIEAIEYNNQLISAGYNKEKTSLAAVIERDDVQNYFEAAIETSLNTKVLVAKLDVLEKTVEGLGPKLDKVSSDVVGIRVENGKQNVEITSLKDGLLEVKTIIYWAVGILLTGGFAFHKYAHRED